MSSFWLIFGLFVFDLMARKSHYLLSFGESLLYPNENSCCSFLDYRCRSNFQKIFLIETKSLVKDLIRLILNDRHWKDNKPLIVHLRRVEIYLNKFSGLMGSLLHTI